METLVFVISCLTFLLILSLLSKKSREKDKDIKKLTNEIVALMKKRN